MEISKGKKVMYMKEITIKITGMMCNGCVAGATMALEDVEGVSSAKVSLENKNAVVIFDGSKTNREVLEAAIIEAGFNIG